MSSDWRSQVNLRCARQLPSTLHFEQSAKGKKEINSTLTNVNKVLSGQRWRIDSIKRANVPLACLSFNYITESLLHISAPRTSDSPSHQRTYELCGTRACLHVSVDMCVCVCVCMYNNLCVDSIALHLLKWAALPEEDGAELRPAVMPASIDASGLGFRLRQPLPCGPWWGDPSRDKVQEGRTGWALQSTD